MNVLKLFFAFFSAVIITACATTSTPTTVNPNATYRYDLLMTVNGVQYSGVGIVPKAPSYTISIESTVDVDLFTITSCHRDASADSAITVNWFHPKRGYTYVYNPIPGIEDVGSCLFRVSAYNKGKGASAFGVLDFQTTAEQVPAVNQCNGVTNNTTGVSICQSRAGLLEMITFPYPMQQASNLLNPSCQMTSTDGGKTWRYVMPVGECVIAFKQINGPGIHRLTTIGFSDIIVQ